MKKFIISNNFILKMVFTILCLSILMYNLIHYCEYNKIISHDTPIVYGIVEASIINGAKGNSYNLKVIYKNFDYDLQITSNTYFDIIDKKMPKLYYSKKMDTVFCYWQKKQAFRVLILSFVGLVVSLLLPLNKLQQK